MRNMTLKGQGQNSKVDLMSMSRCDVSRSCYTWIDAS